MVPSRGIQLSQTLALSCGAPDGFGSNSALLENRIVSNAFQIRSIFPLHVFLCRIAGVRAYSAFDLWEFQRWRHCPLATLSPGEVFPPHVPCNRCRRLTAVKYEPITLRYCLNPQTAGGYGELWSFGFYGSRPHTPGVIYLLCFACRRAHGPLAESSDHVLRKEATLGSSVCDGGRCGWVKSMGRAARTTWSSAGFEAGLLGPVSEGRGRCARSRTVGAFLGQNSPFFPFRIPADT